MDLPETQFLQLVSEGVLPRPRKIGPFERWDADELRAVLRGDKIDPLEDVQW
jgi:predicted DNA-binding transcriptional regulator AlpA